MTTFPDTTSLPLARPISDHLPCMIKVGTSIPKAKVFRFDNYWLSHSSFRDVVINAWNIPVGFTNSAKKINAKFKNLRRALKKWAQSLSCLKPQIVALNEYIFLFDSFKEFRDLSIWEWNCRVF